VISLPHMLGRVRVGAFRPQQDPQADQGDRDAADEPDPPTLRNQKRRDAGYAEGRQRGVGCVAARDAKTGEKPATPAAGECAAQDQDKHRAR